MEFDGRTSTRFTCHFDISPAHAIVPSGAEGFHASFLGREPGRVSLHPVCLGVAIPNLAIRKDAVNEALTKPLNRFCNSRYFGYIDSGANDHCDTLAQEL